jgi:hypothetical protein
MQWPIATLALMLAAGLSVVDSAGVRSVAVTKQQADSMEKKIALIQRQGSEPAPAGTRRRTSVTEGELNSWFTYVAPPLLPNGLADPKLTIVDGRTVVGEAVADLDAVSKSRASGGTFDLWNLIGGRVPVTVTGLLQARGGKVRFELQSAQVAGVSVSPRVVQMLLGYFSRSPAHPDGLRLDEEYELPAGIKDIELGPGTAVVVQ